ncbi:bifunctional diaminohydroxyphosphoribosylaminopyrimidine deaminase/5-amino-6-(5-phosphoribosylamino)uracil reductase RibD [Benzoatithermus flavus]|uniref:Riboflavin biosynthesis protein RibD n=1 Tax=Benzoatithermus flavus TaxID=3108223 RepID=A0ABU8XL61_9PROT
MTEASDRRHMATALALAERGLGNVWPNPAVGCVLVKDGRIVGRGWTQPGGRPHAEREAILRAGEAARGSTAYVTLEPCAHQGRTPPCADAMIAVGIARTVIAAVDPDPRVNGRGIARLHAAGIAVEVGCLEAQAQALNAGFFARCCRGRPLVSLKLATSADGKIATATGESQWITGPEARAEGHRLRLRHDAILVGSGTALADDPLLTCRLPGLEARSPVRIVLDRRLRLAPSSRLARSARAFPVWLFTRRLDTPEAEALAEAGVRLFPLASEGEGAGELREVLATLAGQGITRVLVEGGAGIATAFLRERLVDRLYLFDAPLLIGADGRPAVQGLSVRRLVEARRWRRIEDRLLGPDRLGVLEPAEDEAAT